MYLNLFQTRNQTDHVWLLILVRVKKGEASQDNDALKAASHHFVGGYF